MALLHYVNLTSHRPDMLMQDAFFGLGDFFRFLDTTKQYLESPKAIKRLSWELADREKDDEKENEKSVWVQLIEPVGVTENFEDNFKLFLDEGNNDVYEASASNWASIGAASRECTRCMSNKGKRKGKPKTAYQTKEHADEIASALGLSTYECPHGQGWHLTSEPKEEVSFSKSNKIKILDRDPEKEQILLERLPTEGLLVLRPNTHQITCQIQAIQKLQNAPTKIHRPLLRLFEASNHVEWPSVRTPKPLGGYDPVNKWFVLTDNQRPGTDEQRKFVKIALNTPDFAFLEGPPGSGKTTAICELVIQLALRGKRILLCASTHVAVDNVLERLMDEDNVHRDCILPIRIGDSSRISLKAEPWQLEKFIPTECNRLKKSLRGAGKLSNAQKELDVQLRAGNETIQKMVLESANLVCGTTIGILRHPDIPDIRERGEQSPQFDLMIIDEASKTTFQEFLVPALLAKRWVLVGDPKQLSPYVDDESMAVNIEPCLREKYKREACIDVFQASRPNSKQRITSLICSDDQRTIEYYEKQSSHNDILSGTKNTNQEFLPYTSLVIGGKDFLQENKDNLPLDIGHIRILKAMPLSIKMQVDAYLRLKNNGGKLEPNTWESEISWRLARLYEQRLNDEIVDESKNRSTSENLEEQIKHLLPYDDKDNKPTVRERIDLVRRIAFPSVLESLQKGFAGKRQGTALSDGLPSDALDQRCIKLTRQHRMHPDIAEFPHLHIYHKKALFTPDSMPKDRDWSYRPDSKRCVWHDVQGHKNASNANKNESDQIISELKTFDEWAQKKPNSGNERKKAWEVALLTFYRGQERELRNALRKWTGNYYGARHFSRGDKNNPYLDIQVCTVDRFQGHEADLVLLSFSNQRATSFLKSPNRLNVAITRARYQLVVFGNRDGMKKGSGVLSQFANFVTWEKSLGGK